MISKYGAVLTKDRQLQEKDFVEVFPRRYQAMRFLEENHFGDENWQDIDWHKKLFEAANVAPMLIYQINKTKRP